MTTFLRIAIVAMTALTTAVAFGQQTSPSTTSPPKAAQAPLTPEQFDQQLTAMQEQMAKMQQQMAQIQQTQDPAARQQLLQQHLATMQSTMTMMQGAWGGMMGGRMMGGHMMGPMMMWGDYKNLTPDQLAQRQYMMSQWLPMQQMMMNHMMQQQYWTSPAQPPAAPK